MNIGIVSPFNPKEVERYFYPNQEILDINKTATAVHALANEFLQAKHHITIFTSYPMPGKNIILQFSPVIQCQERSDI